MELCTFVFRDNAIVLTDDTCRCADTAVHSPSAVGTVACAAPYHRHLLISKQAVFVLVRHT